MAQQEELVLWIELRWKNAIEKHLNGETLQEHMENVLDELCDQLPEREYERISHEIQSEAAARRAVKEAARTYARPLFEHSFFHIPPPYMHLQTPEVSCISRLDVDDAHCKIECIDLHSCGSFVPRYTLCGMPKHIFTKLYWLILQPCLL